MANKYQDAIKQVSDFALTGKRFPNGTSKVNQKVLPRLNQSIDAGRLECK